MHRRRGHQNTFTVLLELFKDISGLTITIREFICSTMFWSSDHKKEHFSRRTKSESPSWCTHSIWLDILFQILSNYNAPIQLAIHLNGSKLYGSVDITKLFNFCPGDHLQVNTAGLWSQLYSKMLCSLSGEGLNNEMLQLIEL